MLPKPVFQDAEPNYGASAMKPKMPVDIDRLNQAERLDMLEKRVKHLEESLSKTLAALAGKY